METIELVIYQPKSLPNRRYRFPLEKMEVGDCFDAPYETESQRKSIGMICRGWAKQHNKRVTIHTTPTHIEVYRAG